MFERFTDRARRVVVLSQQEARLLGHSHIGTEHLLLGLIREEQGVAARALTALGIGLQVARDRVRQITGEGGEAGLEGHIPFTPRAKRVLELSLREALQLGHDYIGTEHILLGLVREGQGVAAQVLVELTGDLNRVRQQVMDRMHGPLDRLHGPLARAVRAARREPPEVTVTRRSASGRMERTLGSSFRVRLREIEARLSAVEQRVGGFGPDVSGPGRQIAGVPGERHAAADVRDHEQVSGPRDAERGSSAENAAGPGEPAAHPGPATLAEAVGRLESEVEGLRQALRRHGIEPDTGEQDGEA